MGLFDTVHNTDLTTWQTKAWENILNNYFIDGKAPSINEYSTYALECIGEDKKHKNNNNFVYNFIIVENGTIIEIVSESKIPKGLPIFNMDGEMMSFNI